MLGFFKLWECPHWHCLSHCIVLCVLGAVSHIQSLYQRFRHQGLYSASGEASYCKISWCLGAARFGFRLFQSLWKLKGTSVILLSTCLSYFGVIWSLKQPISQFWDFMRFGGKTPYHLVNRGPKLHCLIDFSLNFSVCYPLVSYLILSNKFTRIIPELTTEKKHVYQEWCHCDYISPQTQWLRDEPFPFNLSSI